MRSVLRVSSALRGVRGFRHTVPRLASRQAPHGGVLKENMVPVETQQDLRASCEGRVTQLSDRQSCDVELIMNGGFSPLEGFMGEETYESVIHNMKLPDGLLFSLPVVMDSWGEHEVGQRWLLQHQGVDVAIMEVTDKWCPDKPVECQKCYGTTTIEHPGVRMVAMERGPYYIGGKVWGLNYPKREFPCQTPASLREDLPDGDVVAFQCRNPIHRAHYELFIRSRDAPNVDTDNSVVLVHPTCGPTQEEDIPGDVRYRTYEVLKEELNRSDVMWAYLPYSMHMAGPREALQHMMVRKNYGCTHFLVGRDMAGSKSSISGDDFYGEYDAQDFAHEYAEELGVQVVPSLNLVYTKEKDYITADEAKKEGLKPMKLSGTMFRKMLKAGEDIPSWFAFPSVVKVLREAAQKQD